VLYRQKFDTFIRIYDDVGYITNQGDFGDRVTNKSGAVFLKALSRKPREFTEILTEMASNFKNTDMAELKKDALEFYKVLEADGFIISGESETELNNKDTRFSYSSLQPKTIREDFSPMILRADKDTQTYLEAHFKEKPHLTQFQIELTSRCNERCVHCYIPHENKTSDIDLVLFYDVLDQCHDMGILNLTLSGGEPMVHPNFLDFLRKAKDYDFSINVLSNLTLLNDEIIAEMKANRLSSVQVSLYSMTPEIHDSVTQIKGSFYKTRDAILRLIENDIPLQISCPVMKQNKNSSTEVLNWGKSHKVRTVTDYIMMARYDRTTGNLDNRLSVEEAGEVINGVIENDPNYQDRVKEADFTEIDIRDTSEEIVCGVCISSLCMVANGNCYPCAGWQSYVVGNVQKTPLREIWESSPKVQYLRNLRKKNFPKCLSCADKTFCAMCMVRNANENPEGDPLKINEHFCKVANLNRKIVLDWKRKLLESKEKGAAV
jgi:radical SAM protein with 4Fe4S-binding SPASM domain